MNDLNIIFEFYITHFEFSPDFITELIGINPTSITIEGEYETRFGVKVNKVNEWCYSTPNLAGIDIEVYLENEMFVLFTDDVISKLKSLSNNFECGLIGYIYLDVEESKPAIIFPTRILNILSELSGKISIDLYTI